MCSNMHSWAGKLPIGAVEFEPFQNVSALFTKTYLILAWQPGSSSIWSGKCLTLMLMKEAADE